jgi:hypothetical protein
MSAVSVEMSVPEAIERTIREITEKYSLNACEIHCKYGSHRSKQIQWISHCGVLGNIYFKIPLSKFEKSLEEGVKCISTLISFSTLLNIPENHEFAENILTAMYNGAPNLYHLDSGNENQVNAYIGFMTPPVFGTPIGSYRMISVTFDVNPETGVYHWKLPDSITEVYDDIRVPSTLGDETGNGVFTNEWEAYRQMGESEFTPARREITAYDSIGLVNAESSSIPILEAVTSICHYSHSFQPTENPGAVEELTGNPEPINGDVNGDDGNNDEEAPQGPPPPMLARRHSYFENTQS